MSAHVGRRPAQSRETQAANRAWWDGAARDYYAEHGDFLGDAEFVWGPEGWTEEMLNVLSVRPGQRLLEVGCGAAQCARWIQKHHRVQVVASDLSGGMLAVAADLNTRTTIPTPLVQADALTLPHADGTFDTVFTAYGVVPFIADFGALMKEVARVLRPGGLLAFSTTHPMRWCFADDPGEGGLTATMSYFDRTPYVESDAHGEATYVEHHRTMGDYVRDIVAAQLAIEDVIELEWPADTTESWGGWSPLRGAIMPGTVIIRARHRS